ncbi:hypothetical protein BEL04_19125 [Mucilaginibacter sp. PPCGB 2223]|uniref:hypothetical protein n=1 Tax=Mucilaginibacter sp. PPCGB 2223 TaxID=1886027 RepID=UPI0008259E2D|nr:hypothetical protein [Mucilaginibacter sp. PPCGB 2223]OCX50841.1 hypothetical protein BEL04_19125 [Mucilaginibacter sp. PPCGB 2223]
MKIKLFIPIILKYSCILLLSKLIIFWLFDYSSFDIPEHIPYTPIMLRGVLIFVLVLSILIFSEKVALKKDATINIAELTMVGVLTILIADVIFQMVRVATFDSNRLYLYLNGLLSLPIMVVEISFFTAFQLKTRKTERLLLYIGIYLLIAKGFTMVFPQIFNPA